MDEVDILVVRVSNICRTKRRAVISNFHAKEQVRNPVRVAGCFVTSVGQGLGAGRDRRGRADANHARAAAYINGAAGLMDVDRSDLPDSSSRFCRAVCQAAIIGTLDHCHSRLERPIQQVNLIFPIEFLPLAVITRSTAGGVAEWIILECNSFIRRTLCRNIRRDKAGSRECRRIICCKRCRVWKSDREINITAAVRTYGSRIFFRKRIRLPAIYRVTHKRIVRRTGRLEIEVPQVDARRNTSDTSHIVITEIICSAARFTVASCGRSLNRDVRAKRNPVL